MSGTGGSFGFTHLHGHSTYSFQDGARSPEKIGQRILELGHRAVALTDHGNIVGHVPLQIAAKKLGFQPVFGCEFYVVNNIRSKSDTLPGLGANQFPHVTVMARTQTGYENLLALSRRSWIDGYWYKPRVDWSMIEQHQEGLIVLSGCPLGFPTRLITLKDETACFEWLRERQQRIEGFYCELVPAPYFDVSHATLGTLARMAAELRLPTVLTADGHFPRLEDHHSQDIMLCVGIGKRASDEREFRLPPWQYYCDEHELLQRAAFCAPDIDPVHWQCAADNTGRIARTVEVELPRAKQFTFAGRRQQDDPAEMLWDWIKKGLIERDIPLERLPAYEERAHYEWTILRDKGFCDYILTVGDIIREMRRRGCMVVTRGSAGGSLILWLIGASVTDPLKHGLSFERFYDYTRTEPPDVDIDFEQGFRPQAIAYVTERYGADHVSQLAAFAQIKPKSALNDVAFYYDIPRHAYAALAKQLSSGDDDVQRQLHHITDPAAVAVLAQHPELLWSSQIVGEYRQPNIHAAGLLISPIPLHQVVGVMLGKDKQHVASVDKRGAAYLGFVKMDLLAVMALDIVGAAVRKLGKDMAWLEGLPLDDAGALDIARRGLLAGIFQLNGASAQRVARQVGIDRFEDLVVVSALCRPGPSEWVETYKRNKENPGILDAYLKAIHPTAAAIVRETYGVLLTQEQVMRLARELCGLDWPDVQKFRKAINDKMLTHPDAEKREAWIKEWHEKIAGGCVRAGCSPQEAEFWWTSCATHGAYSFNKSHVTTYGLLGYWMCYLKAHFPAALYDAYLAHETDAITMKRLIREFMALGGEVHLLDPHASKETFSSPYPGLLVGGYRNLFGVGAKTARRLVESGPFHDWQQLYRAMPEQIATRLRYTGAGAVYDGGRPDAWDAQETILLAPWFPVPRLGAEEDAVRRQYALPTLDQLTPGAPISGDVVVCGYVTATKFEKKRVMFVLEDETQSIVVRVAAKHVETLGPLFRDLGLADFVIVRGWWSGDALYSKSRVIARPAHVERRAARREAEDWAKGIFSSTGAKKQVTLSRAAAKKIGGIAVNSGQSLAQTSRCLIHAAMGLDQPEFRKSKEAKAGRWANGDFSKERGVYTQITVGEEVGALLGQAAHQQQRAVVEVMRALIYRYLGIEDAVQEKPTPAYSEKDAINVRPPVPEPTEEELENAAYYGN